MKYLFIDSCEANFIQIRVGKKKTLNVDLVEMLSKPTTNFSKSEIKRILKEGGIDIWLIKK